MRSLQSTILRYFAVQLDPTQQLQRLQKEEKKNLDIAEAWLTIRIKLFHHALPCCAAAVSKLNMTGQSQTGFDK